MKKEKTLWISLMVTLILILSLAIPVLPVQAANADSTAGQVTTASGGLNVRSSPSTSGGILTVLPRGSFVTLIAKTGGWWQVEYASGSYGYVSGDYITQLAGSKSAAVQVASSLNVRSGGGTSYPVQGWLYAGNRVVVLSTANGWSRILYHGIKTGYVSSQYLSLSSSASAVWPVPASRRMNQYFGNNGHKGIDIGASAQGVTGDRIVAALSGEVVHAGWLSGYGYVVYVNSYYNGQYLQTRYGHLVSSPSVSAGAQVTAGQTVGYMGNTGTSTGVHLHFEVRVRSNSGVCLANAESTPVDPLNYVSIY